MTDVSVTYSRHLGGHQHGISIQSSITDLGETLFWTREWKLQKPNSWQGCLYINHLSYPRFFLIECMVMIFSFDKWPVKTSNTFYELASEEEGKTSFFFHSIRITKPVPRANIEVSGISIYFLKYCPRPKHVTS